MDHLVARRLLLVRQLYNHGTVQAAHKEVAFRRIVSVITLDLAVETLLKIIVNFLDPKKTPGDSFNSVLSQVDSLFQKSDLGEVPHRGSIVHVHSLRNDAQHKAKYPNERDVEESEALVRAFLDEALTRVWNRSLDSISLSELIRDEMVKELVSRAEDALENSDYVEVVKNSNAGLTLAMDFARARLFPNSRRRLYQSIGLVDWRFGSQATSPMLDETLRFMESALEDQSQAFDRKIDGLRSDISTLRDEAKREFDLMEDLLLLPLLGISHADFLRFRQLAGNVRFLSIEDLRFDVLGMKQELEQSEAEFVLAFSAGVITEIQDRVSDQI